MDIDLYRANIAAAAVQRGGERQVAVFARVEGRVDDKPDGTGISGAVAQAAAAAIDRAGVHAGAAADAFERGPEFLQPQPFRPAVIDEHEMHFAAGPWAAEMRGVLGHRRAQCTA